MKLPELKRQKRSLKAIEKFFEDLFKSEDSSLKVEVFEADQGLRVCVQRMFRYVEYDLKTLHKMAEFFGTWDISDDRYFTGGCKTCDYGSDYKVTFRVKYDGTRDGV